MDRIFLILYLHVVHSVQEISSRHDFQNCGIIPYIYIYSNYYQYPVPVFSMGTTNLFIPFRKAGRKLTTGKFSVDFSKLRNHASYMVSGRPVQDVRRVAFQSTPY